MGRDGLETPGDSNTLEGARSRRSPAARIQDGGWHSLRMETADAEPRQTRFIFFNNAGNLGSPRTCSKSGLALQYPASKS